VTVAGGGLSREEGAFALDADLSNISALALGPDDTLYIALVGSEHKILQLAISGQLITVAGSGEYGSGGDGGDGGLAIHAKLQSVKALTVNPNGIVYFADGEVDNGRIRSVYPNGRIFTVAGGGNLDSATALSGTHATSLRLGRISALAIDDLGNAIAGDRDHHWIIHVGEPLQNYTVEGDLLVPDKDGKQVYRFDATGRHLATLNAITGIPIHLFDYDPQGNLIRVTDRHGNANVIERDADGVPQAIVAPDGQRTLLAHDSNGYVNVITDPAGSSHRMTMSAGGQLLQYRNPRDQLWTYTYDGSGKLVKDLEPNGGGWTLSRTKLPDGYQISLTSGEGRHSVFEQTTAFDGSYRRRITDPDGHTREILLQPSGDEARTLSDGTRVDLSYGPDPRFGLLSPVMESGTITTPAGLVAVVEQSRSLTPDGFEETLSTNGRQTTADYDGNSRLWRLTTPVGRQVEINLDSLGEVRRVVSPGSTPIDLTRDTRGRVIRWVQGSGEQAREFSVSYDSEGNLNTLTDPLNAVYRYNYDSVGRLTGAQLPDGREFSTGYDPNGNPVSVTPPGRPAHRFEYDSVDEVDAYEPPDLAGVAEPATTYSYNRDKQLIRVQRPDGKAVDLTYNAAGLLGEAVTPIGAYRYGYDAPGGYLSSISAPSGIELQYGYDGFLETAADWSGIISGRVSQIYDSNFELARRCVNSVLCIDHAYDNDMLLTQAGELVIARNSASGQLSDTTLGIVGTEMAYNSYGEMASYRAAVDGSVVAVWTYTRDKLGRIQSRTETLDGETHVTAYTYDLVGRLIEVKKEGVLYESYGYDANGNRTHLNGEAVGDFDEQDRMLRHGDATYTYNENGDLESKTEAGSTTAYDYDVLGNLQSVVLPGDMTIEYLVDGQNRRVAKKVNGALIQGFLYRDQLNPIAELDAEGNVVSRFVYGERENVPSYLVKMDPSTGTESTYRIVTDHLGSPRLVVDTTNGSIVQRLDFDPWGSVTLDTNPGFQPFGFAGGLYDIHTGLVRFGARDYDPGAGRWTAKDPIGFDGDGPNLYGYVLNDPVNLIDRTGFWSISIGAGGGANYLGIGGSANTSISADSEGNVCFQFTTCTGLGPGFFGGLGITGGISNGNLCDGDSEADTGVIEGGFGPIGGISIGRDQDGNISGGKGIAGIGGGGAGGVHNCKTRTICLN